MSRLLLEICPESTSGNGAAAALPSIVICSGDEPAPVAVEGVARPLVLRWQNGAYALEQPSASGPAALGIGQWHKADGWNLRVTQAPPGNDDLALTGASPNWAAPELRITTYDGDRVKRLRCMLPVEEASQLIIGRDGAKADLVVEDEHVSRAHLRFFVRDGKQLVEDLGSRWGSKLNDQPLTDPRPLAHGDEIRLGKSSIQYICYWELLPSPEAKSAAPPVVGAALPAVESPPKVIAAPAPVAAKAESPAAKAGEGKLPVPEPAALKVSPDMKPEPAKAAPESKLPVVVKPAAKAQSKRKLTGFDIGGAIVLVLLLLAGMGYLAYQVFGP